MLRLGLAALAVLLHIGLLKAQTEADTTVLWKKGGAFNLTFTQVALSNWAAGGEGSYAAGTFLTAFANYKKDKLTWDNKLDLGYGVIKQKKRELVKSDDKIDLSSKIGRYAFKHWYYSGLVNFKTQFAEGYKNDSILISDFLAPGYLLLSLGMDFKPNDDFTMLIAPLTGKTTFVRDQSLANKGAFGVEPAVRDTSGNILTEGENIRNEFGGYIKINYKKDIVENITLSTGLELFSNYLENPDRIDINWEVLVVMKINKFLTANISTQLIYDHDIDIQVNDEATKFGPRTQFKEVFGLNFSYKF